MHQPKPRPVSIDREGMARLDSQAATLLVGRQNAPKLLALAQRACRQGCRSIVVVALADNVLVATTPGCGGWAVVRDPAMLH